MNPMRNTPRDILIELRKIKDKKNIKSNEGKATNNLQGNSNKVINWFFIKTSIGQRGVAQYI